VFQQLRIPLLCRGAAKLLDAFLLGYQHSPCLFHSVVPQLPSAFDALQGLSSVFRSLFSVVFLIFPSAASVEHGVAARDALRTLQGTVIAMMLCHSGYPSLYAPLLPYLKGGHQNVETVRDRLERYGWLTRKSLGTAGPALAKAAGSPTGLLNLGNSCYMVRAERLLFLFRSDIDAVEHCFASAVPHTSVVECFSVRLRGWSSQHCVAARVRPDAAQHTCGCVAQAVVKRAGRAVQRVRAAGCS